VSSERTLADMEGPQIAEIGGRLPDTDSPAIGQIVPRTQAVINVNNYGMLSESIDYMSTTCELGYKRPKLWISHRATYTRHAIQHT